jgi:hypothetical protein
LVHKIFPTPTSGADPNFWYGVDHNKLIEHLHGIDKSDPFTFTVDQDTFKHSTTNVAGDLLKGDGTRYSRFAKGTEGQVLTVSAGATDLEWADPEVGVGVWDPDAVETLTGKTINITDNTLTADSIAVGDLLVADADNFNRRGIGTANQILKVNAAATDIEWGSHPIGALYGGSTSFSGNGTNKIFNIPHGLTAGTPDVYFAAPKTVAAMGSITVVADATNIVVTYVVAPVSGTDNVTLVWGAGYTAQAEVGFSPTSTNTVTNKSMSGATNTFSAIPMTALAGAHLIFDKISVPADQADHEDTLLYNKELDVDNNALTVKQQIGDTIVEVSSF